MRADGVRGGTKMQGGRPREFNNPDAARGTPLPVLIRDYERRLIAGALAAAYGSQKRAAAALGVRPTTLSMKMKRLGLRAGRPTGSDERC
jgi:DNA-binding NtrC family response regulator